MLSSDSIIVLLCYCMVVLWCYNLMSLLLQCYNITDKVSWSWIVEFGGGRVSLRLTWTHNCPVLYTLGLDWIQFVSLVPSFTCWAHHPQWAQARAQAGPKPGPKPVPRQKFGIQKIQKINDTSVHPKQQYILRLRNLHG